MPVACPTDDELMAELKGGADSAYRELLRRHRTLVERFLYSLLWDRALAEDLAQEVFVRLWLARERYEPRGIFSSYLYRIAKNVWLHERERQNHRPATASLDDAASPAVVEVALRAMAHQPTLPEQVLFANERRFRIRQAIAKLPPGQRLVFTLSHFEDLRYAEIAEVLDIPVGTVKSRMNAAVTKLRRHLGHIVEE